MADQQALPQHPFLPFSLLTVPLIFVVIISLLPFPTHGLRVKSPFSQFERLVSLRYSPSFPSDRFRNGHVRWQFVPGRCEEYFAEGFEARHFLAVKKEPVSRSLVIMEMQIKHSELPQLFFCCAGANLRMKLVHSGGLGWRELWRKRTGAIGLFQKYYAFPGILGIWDNTYLYLN